MLRGSDRSASANHGPLGSGIDGAHQASSMRSVAAPIAPAATIGSPVFDAAPSDRSGPAGAR